jgi:peptidoglycan/LPS O-acetylase OafA/YrhL
MLQGLAAGQLSWNYPAWSISVEFIAYLVLPFALPVIGRAPQAARLVLGAVLFAVLALLAAFTQGVLDQWNGPITLIRCMPEFLARSCTSHSAIMGSASGSAATCL